MRSFEDEWLAGLGKSSIVMARRGRVAEWLKALDSKSSVRVTVPGVRIPPLPPLALDVLFSSLSHNPHFFPQSDPIAARTTARISFAVIIPARSNALAVSATAPTYLAWFFHVPPLTGPAQGTS
jgi:hypothetical protein